MRKKLVKLLFIALFVFGMLFSCVSPEQQKIFDAQKEFCEHVKDYQDKFIDDNAELTDLQKKTALLLLVPATKDYKEDEDDEK